MIETMAVVAMLLAGPGSAVESCEASWFRSRRVERTGELMYVAHKTEPKGRRMLVWRRDDPSRRVQVTVRDRGPYVRGRCLDLSKTAFGKLAPTRQGVVQVSWAQG